MVVWPGRMSLPLFQLVLLLETESVYGEFLPPHREIDALYDNRMILSLMLLSLNQTQKNQPYYLNRNGENEPLFPVRLLI